ELDRVRVGELVRSHDCRSDRREARPGLAQAKHGSVLRLPLQVAVGDVLTDRYAGYVAPCVTPRYLAGCGPHDDDEFDLPVDAGPGYLDRGTRAADRTRELGEDHWYFGEGPANLGDVRVVVDPDAEHLPGLGVHWAELACGKLAVKAGPVVGPGAELRPVRE